MTKYTFTFKYDQERKFKEVLSRLDESDYNIIKDVCPIESENSENERYADKEAIIEMDPESALTFRLGMKELKIRRERTEEELAEEKEKMDRHKIRIDVIVPKEQ